MSDMMPSRMHSRLKRRRAFSKERWSGTRTRMEVFTPLSAAAQYQALAPGRAGRWGRRAFRLPRGAEAPLAARHQAVVPSIAGIVPKPPGFQPPFGLPGGRQGG